jgi:glycosyltransferase involved in cell wall biosynthesis
VIERTPIQARPRRLRCLLVSPVAPPELRNGDSQYTEDLLRDPPEGVEYVTHEEAAANGEIEWGPSVRDGATWRRPRDLPAALARGGLGAARRLGLLLSDPVSWIRVLAPFDVVHVHCTPVRFLGPRPPVLLSDSAGTFWYWTAGLGMDEGRVLRLLRRERALARRIGYLHPTVHPAAERVVYFVESGIELAARIGIDVSGATICAPGVPSARVDSRSDGRTLLFVARSFEVKGGPDALRVLARVRESLPDARLIVAGSDPPASVPEGVEWLGPLSREQLYEEAYPRADVFVYPTRFDTTGFVVEEALAHGLPVVAPRALCLPDVVRHGETGYLQDPWDVDEAAATIVELLEDRDRHARLRAAARADFERRMSPGARNEVLGGLYRSLAP